MSFLTVKQFAQRQPGISESSVRQAIFYRNDDLEAAGAVTRLGRRVLIDEERFLQFLTSGGLRRVRGGAQ